MRVYLKLLPSLKVSVLILVIVEYALWESNIMEKNLICLNPCYSGICSVSYKSRDRLSRSHIVLILVIVEYALWDGRENADNEGQPGLNPCYSGICSVLHEEGQGGAPVLVLILVIVEYALCMLLVMNILPVMVVLILVIVEYALWAKTHNHGNILRVLILVIVEYALWGCFVYVVEI